MNGAGAPGQDGVNSNSGYESNDRNYGYQENGQGYGYGQQDGYAGGYPEYQYPQQGGYEQELEPPVTVGEWLVSMLLLLIPCVGIVLMFVWAFSGNEKKSKANYFKASLILTGIVLALYLLVIIFVVALAAARF